MSETKHPQPSSFPTEKRYQFVIQAFLQIIIFLLGYVISRPIGERTNVDPLLILFLIGFASSAVYLLRNSYSSNSSGKISSIPRYWNDRIIGLQSLWFDTKIAKEPRRSTMMNLYLSGLEINYEAALLEGREALAKRFRELIDRCENELQK